MYSQEALSRQTYSLRFSGYLFGVRMFELSLLWPDSKHSWHILLHR
jgi:hypothetical protein